MYYIVSQIFWHHLKARFLLIFLCPNVYSYECNFLVFLATLTATPMSQIKPHLVKVVFLGPFTKYKWKIQEFSSDFSFRGSSCCACNRTQCVPDVGSTFVPLSFTYLPSIQIPIYRKNQYLII